MFGPKQESVGRAAPAQAVAGHCGYRVPLPYPTIYLRLTALKGKLPRPRPQTG